MQASPSSKIQGARQTQLSNSELEREAVSQEESGYKGIMSRHSFLFFKEKLALKRRDFQG